ncbi:4Fe-4S binding protein [Deltaproteobacteria bacterium TL4]
MPSPSLFLDLTPLKDDHTLATGGSALWSIESKICDHICLEKALAPSPLVPSPPMPESNLFNRPFRVSKFSDAENGFGLAMGLGVTGKRVALWLTGSQLAKLQIMLTETVNRHIPLVCHVINGSINRRLSSTGGGHQGYHALSETGAFQLYARNVQHAVDLAIVLRKVAEQALIPGVLATDASETAFALETLSLPGSGFLKDFIHSPKQSIPSQTPSQRFLFHEKRRQIPQWLHWDTPCAQGWPMEGLDYATSRAGHHIFHEDPLMMMAQTVMTELSAITGRPLAFITRYQLGDAEHIIVAQGHAVETAETAANYLRSTKGWKVGVLGIVCLRPFPADLIRKAIPNAKNITILERTEPQAPAQLPLRREIASLFTGTNVRLLSGVYGLGGQPFALSQMLAVYENMNQGSGAQETVVLGISTANKVSEYPKRQMLLQSLHNDYPKLDKQVLPEGKRFNTNGETTRSVSLYTHHHDLAPDTLQLLAQALAKQNGPHVKSSIILAERGFWCGRVMANPNPIQSQGNEYPTDITLVTRLDVPSSISPFHLAHIGKVIIASTLEDSTLATLVLRTLHKDAHLGQGKFYRFKGTGSELIKTFAQAPQALQNQITELVLATAQASPSEVEPPAFLKANIQTSQTYDSLPKYWGEFLQPRIEGEMQHPIPSPRVTLGTLPSSTAAFMDKTPMRQQTPSLNKSVCTGCGNCWTSCPDSAFGTVTFVTEKLLSAVAESVHGTQVTSDSIEGKLKRAYRNLATRINRNLDQRAGQTLTEELIQEAFVGLLEKLNVSEGERPQYQNSFNAISKKLLELPLVVSQSLFYDQEHANKGTGEILFLAINPNTCQGCGVCQEVCPEQAITMPLQTTSMIQEMRQNWKICEDLPDTDKASIETLKNSSLGVLASLFLSRHCAQSLSGGTDVEAGSGAQLALRLVTGITEYTMQHQIGAYVQTLKQLKTQIKKKIKELIADSVPMGNLGLLDEALAELTGNKTPLSEVVDKIKTTGETSVVDLSQLKHFTHYFHQVEHIENQILSGKSGFGRARYSLILASQLLYEQTYYPLNPYQVPVLLDLSTKGVSLALGAVEGLIQAYVEEVRQVRVISQALQSSPKIAEQDPSINKLSWQNLSPEEKQACPPILLVLDDETLSNQPLRGLSELQSSGYPIKIIILDEKENFLDQTDPTLIAIANRKAMVLSSSLAHARHLGQGLLKAMSSSQPSFVHLYTPSPSRHGFVPKNMIQQAKMAVACGVHPLLSYDPQQEGVLGLRIELAMDDAVRISGSEAFKSTVLNLVHWAFTESRFSKSFNALKEGNSLSNGLDIEVWIQLSPDQRKSKEPTLSLLDGRVFQVSRELAEAAVIRQEMNLTLQELAGIASPFTARIRGELEEELKQKASKETVILKSQHESEIQQVRLAQQQEQVKLLSQRLLDLSQLEVN